jgi:hypothetical protein
MRVQALQDGFFGGSLRVKGSFFFAPDDAKASWFVEVEDAPEPAPKLVSRASPKGVALPGQAAKNTPSDIV